MTVPAHKHANFDLESARSNRKDKLHMVLVCSVKATRISQPDVYKHINIIDIITNC